MTQTLTAPDAPAKRDGQRAVPIPLSATEWVTLQGGFPLTPEAWDQLMRVLAVMKLGLVAPPSADADAD